MTEHYHKIERFLSSSELNRCKRNGLLWYKSHSVEEWLDYFKQPWLTRKLRRKLGHLYHLDLLAIKKVTYIQPVISEDEKSLFDKVVEAWYKLEDETIMKGNN